MSVKRGKRVQSLKIFFTSSILQSKGMMDRGLKDESSHKISAQKILLDHEVPRF